MLRRTLFAAALPLFVTPLATSAREYRLGGIVVHQPWSRAMPPVARNGAAYFVAVNESATADRLLEARGDVAERVELHTHENVDGVMKMHRVDGVDLPPGGEATFAPGGLHVMLIGLRQPLAAGGTFPLTLVFEQAGEIELEVRVEEGAPAAAHTHAQ